VLPRFSYNEIVRTNQPTKLSMTKLTLHLLGTFQVEYDHQPVTQFRSDKERALLAYLAVEHNRPHRRDTLIGLLWPEQPQNLAQNNLRKALTRLRQTIPTPESYLLITPAAVQFNPDAVASSAAWLDVQAFESLNAECQQHHHRHLETCPACAERMRQAVTLHRGEFLSGLNLRDCAAFEEWVSVRRESQRHVLLLALTNLAEYHLRRGEWEAAADYARKQTALIPWQEEAHQQLMRAYAAGGDRSRALAQYQTCVQILRDELNIAPSSETRAVFESLRESVSLSKSRTLPVMPAVMPLTTFIGREAELARINERLADPNCRLLTLSGSGGAGKTRLALQTVRAQQTNFKDGVKFIDLAPLNSAASIPSALATSLGLPLSSQEDIWVKVLSHLRSKEMLLVLDNMEHLLTGNPTGAELVLDLLRAAPQVVCLVTSREALQVQAEWRLPISGLSYPSAAQVWSAAAPFAAIELFTDRARRIGTEVNAEALPAATRICQMVEGLPLAIELAAVWTSDYPIEVTAQRIAQHLDFLTTKQSDRPARHRSLRAVFEHSWALLSPIEQSVLSSLAVFRGGFDLAAAQAVAKATPALISALVNKSLVRENPSRWTLLETIREYAAEKCIQAGNETDHRNRHAQYWLSVVEAAAPHLKGGAKQAECLDHLDSELNNLRAALDWMLSQKQADTAQRLGAGLGRFWVMRGYWSEGREWLGKIMEMQPTRNKSAKHCYGMILNWAGDLAWRQSDYPATQRFAEQALALGRSSNDHLIQAGALDNLGNVAYFQGKYAESQTYLTEALTFARAADDLTGMTSALSRLGSVAFNQGNYAQAQTLYEEAVNFQREPQRGDFWILPTLLNRLGNVLMLQGNYARAQSIYQENLESQQNTVYDNPSNLANTLYYLGENARMQADYAAAQTHYLEGLQLVREMGDRVGVAVTLHRLGMITLLQDDAFTARTYLEESLVLRRELNSRQGVAETLHELGIVAAYQGDYISAHAQISQGLALRATIGDQAGIAYSLAALAWLTQIQTSSSLENMKLAAQLLAFSETLIQSLGVQPAKAEQERQAAVRVAMQYQLGEAAFTAAWAIGCKLSLEQVLILSKSKKVVLN
jgi:predicted ATPase/DNA-binding SARP family transcriptional activator